MKESKNKTITILGCGWLGKIVGEALVASNHRVYGTYRDETQVSELTACRILPVYCDFLQNPTLPDEIRAATDTYLIFLPPSVATEEFPYFQLLQNLAAQFHLHSTAIFSSSTGIYPSQDGTFDETFLFTESQKDHRLWKAENALLSELGPRLTILRLGGLIGPKRHPAFSLQGRTLSNDGMAPVNLIHAFDISGAIDRILTENHFGATYNLVFPDHSSKKSYYQNVAIKMGVVPPDFGETTTPKRTVDGSLITKSLSFIYQFPIDKFDLIGPQLK